MANDSSLLPVTPVPPASASLTTVTAGSGATENKAIAYDYSPHLIRVVEALEQISLSLAFVADKMDNVSDKLNVLSANSSQIKDNIENISNSLQEIKNNQETITNLAQGTGINFKGPYEWLSMSSLLRLYQEQKVDIQKLKEEFDRLVPKDF